MGGLEDKQQSLFSYVSLEERIPAKHPFRQIRELVDEAFKQMDGYSAELYSHTGRPFFCPEYLLRASFLQVFYIIHSERLLMEQLDYNFLFRWFVGLSVDYPVWDHSVFSKNRDRLLNTEMVSFFFATIRDQDRQKELISDEHFSLDGTLLEAWASMKSFRPKDVDQDKDDHGQGRDPEIDFQGQKRSNNTHASTTDPDARLYKKAKGQQAQLCYMGHVLMENRNGLMIDSRVTSANGTAEREAAIDMLEQIPGNHRITLSGDKGYDCSDFVGQCRDLKATTNVVKKQKGSGIDGRTTRHEGYRVNLRVRKRAEEVFGWLKTIGGFGKLNHRDRDRVDAVFTFAAAANNLIRIGDLTAFAGDG